MELKIDVVSLPQSSKIQIVLITISIWILTFSPTLVNIEESLMITSLTQKLLSLLYVIIILLFIYFQHLLPDTFS